MGHHDAALGAEDDLCRLEASQAREAGFVERPVAVLADRQQIGMVRGGSDPTKWNGEPSTSS